MKPTCIVYAVCKFLATDSNSLKTELNYDWDATHSDGRANSLAIEHVYKLLAMRSIPIYTTQLNVRRWMLQQEGLYFDLDAEHAVYFKNGLIHDAKCPIPLPVSDYLSITPLTKNCLCLVKLTRTLAKDLKYVTI